MSRDDPEPAEGDGPTGGKRSRRDGSRTEGSELAAVAAEAERRRAAGERIVFTNGCFDLLHPGHVEGLRRAAALGDWLVVGVNGDASVRRLKGAGRPVMPVEERVELLGALRWVDAVVPFEEDTPARLLERLRPDVHVKGADWRDKELPEAALLAEWNGEVVFLDRVPGYSTSTLIERIRELPLDDEEPDSSG